MMGRYDYGYDMMGGVGWFGALLMLAFWLLIVVGIVLLIVWIVRSTGVHETRGGVPPVGGNAGHEEAVAIAKRRLASGEITPDEYDAIMRALGG